MRNSLSYINVYVQYMVGLRIDIQELLPLKTIFDLLWLAIEKGVG